MRVQAGISEFDEPTGGLQPSVDQAALSNPPDATLIRAYFRRVAAEDQPRRAEDIIAIVESHRELGSVRRAGEAKIQVYNPPPSADGWGATSTAVDIVNDDKPHLVDSVITTLSAAGLTVHRVIHPILLARRNADGALIEIVGEATPAAEASADDDVRRESWMHLLVDRLADEERRSAIADDVRAALLATGTVVDDSAAMAERAQRIAAEIRSMASSVNGGGDDSASEWLEAADLLEWLTGRNVILLGYRRVSAAGDDVSAGGPLGMLRPECLETIHPDAGAMTTRPSSDRELAIQQLWLSAGPSRGDATLLVSVPLSHAADDTERAEFLIGLTAIGHAADITTVPVLRRTVQRVLTWLGAVPESYSGQRALAALSAYPRAELFWATMGQVTDVVAGQLRLSSRRRVRTFVQPDPLGRFLSVQVFLPRDRYSTSRRFAMQEILETAFDAVVARYAVHIGDSVLASVHFTLAANSVRGAESVADVDIAALNRQLRHAVRSWEDELVSTVVGGEDDLDAAGALSRYADAFDEAYKEDYSALDAVADLKKLDEVSGPTDLVIGIVRPPAGAPGDSRLKLYVTDPTVSLSRAMPVLHSLGVRVIDERPYSVRRTDGTPSWIYDFGLSVDETQRVSGHVLSETKRRFADAFIAAWQGYCEVDGFNALVLSARLEWREVAVLRAYAKYLRQIGTAYTQNYLEQVLGQHSAITADLAALFTARFDPDLGDNERDERAERLQQQIVAALDAVTSLDADRILRTFMQLILATARTNVYCERNAGATVPHFAFKLNPHKVPGIPKPVPAHEIWVYSPRVEGVHLRFGVVARGGLRWSDRPEDFRTEVLGLVKAQEVKNAIIVPVGAKGGFVLKQAPASTGDAVADRDALQAEGIASYKIFISCMLDVTDNRVGDAVVPPARVVRHDDDDPYLVVAADKGTARFSDIANGVSAEYGYWLGDAFASGGSAGYDHKGMGITARGAWESVKHHFRELGINPARDEYTCVGIGDMSGDVFGNGLLRSDRAKLVAAFDHRHVFVDPSPDPAASFAERQRLFDLPRSSWADYRTELISAGGGVWPRSAKSVPISDQMRRALGIAESVTELTPVDLIRAVLLAPVDLVWNGGIGTYIKASTETHAQVGNKANDAVRVNGDQLRARVVGEGGNLGVTQLGRIEYARHGGRINTDAIDNSAGVDTSDHEVNIKIAMQPLVASGAVSLAQRNELLSDMTETVAELVLADNKAQNRLLGVSRNHAAEMLSVYGRHIDALIADGHLDRDLEFLPTPAQIHARAAEGEGLTSPELAILVAYTKSKLARDMLASDLPASAAYRHRVVGYFPALMADRYGDALANHPLAREIITTMTVNEVVNQAGITYAFRLGEEMAASTTDAIRAFTVVSEVFELPELVAGINAADYDVPAACQDHMTLLLRRVLDRAARWFLSRRPQPLDVQAEIDRYRPLVARINPEIPELLAGVERENVARDTAMLVEMGATEDLAGRVAYCLYAFAALDIIDVADESGRDLIETAGLYYALSAHLDFDHLLTEVSDLARGDRWHALARQAVRDDLYRSMRLLTADVLSTTEPGSAADAKIVQWEQQNASRLTRSRATLSEIARAGARDLAALSVAAREFRSMIR